MRIRLRFGLAAAVLFVSGCATVPQSSVQLAPSTLGSQSGRVGVVMTELPKVDTQLPGAGCLLCIGAAMLANNSLIEYSKTLPYEDLPKLKHDIVAALRAKGVDAIVIEKPVNLSELPKAEKIANGPARDFSSLQQEYQLGKILVIDVAALGFERTYSAYIPTSDPKAMLRGTGYLVNLQTKTYEWYLPVAVLKSTSQNWDEPPQFPGLSNAYFQTLEVARDTFLQPFAN
jgi:hypothetical protein